MLNFIDIPIRYHFNIKILRKKKPPWAKINGAGDKNNDDVIPK